MASKRTTVPFLYSIQGVDNFDVIDFPGVDDQDDHISDLVNLLRTLAQLVVFVVNYRYIITTVVVGYIEVAAVLPYIFQLSIDLLWEGVR